jgi:sec-independent protein translocase protein TatA
MLPHLGPLEIGLIVLLVLIVFGVGRLPQVGSALGKGIREFHKGKAGLEDLGGEEGKEGKDEDTVTKSTKTTAEDKK